MHSLIHLLHAFMHSFITFSRIYYMREANKLLDQWTPLAKLVMPAVGISKEKVEGTKKKKKSMKKAST